jgi:hypothetical protein
VSGWLAYGDPSWGRFVDGRFDFTPVIVAAIGLFLLRALFRVRIGWPAGLGALLLAPLFVALAGHIGLLAATSSALIAASIVTISVRRTRAPHRPRSAD